VSTPRKGSKQTKLFEMKTVLPKSITTQLQARQFLVDLFYNGEAFHPEDSAHGVAWDIPAEQQPTSAECDQLDQLFIDIYNLDGNNGNHANPKFDPCEVLLDLQARKEATDSYLFIGTFPNAYSYCDRTKEEKGDYKRIAAVYFRPLGLKIFSNDAKYEKAIEIATADYEHIKNNINEPIRTSATGQTVRPCLSVEDYY
jgi:hypothetical protein